MNRSEGDDAALTSSHDGSPSRKSNDGVNELLLPLDRSTSPLSKLICESHCKLNTPQDDSIQGGGDGNDFPESCSIVDDGDSSSINDVMKPAPLASAPQSPSTNNKDIHKEGNETCSNNTKIAIQEPKNANSNTYPSDNDSPSPDKPKPKPRAPSPPRWRFVNDAKKTLGYSSLAAGNVVIGKSSQDLAAKYKPPDVSDRNNGDGKDESQVGKLVIREWSRGEEELLVGEFAGFGSRPMEEEEDTTIIADADRDALNMTNYQEAEEINAPVVEEENATIDEYPATVGTTEAIHNDSNTRLSATTTATTDGIQTLPSSSLSIDEIIEVSSHHEKKIFLLLLFLLLAVIAVIIGVVLYNKSNGEEKVQSLQETTVDLDIDDVRNTNIPSISPSATSPSHSPTLVCRANTKSFSVTNGTRNNTQLLFANDATWTLRNACSGEIIMECQPCSSSIGSLTSSLLTRTESEKEPVRHNRERGWVLDTRESIGNANNAVYDEEKLADHDSTVIKECLPIGNEYIFELKISGGIGPCCGLSAAAYVAVTYDNVVVSESGAIHQQASDENDGVDNSTIIFFGERDEPCPTIYPSLSPSSDPPMVLPSTTTNIPSSVPTLTPSQTSNQTYTPTSHPLCTVNNEAFNLCIAIDMSGSVCNRETGNLCPSCNPPLVCNDKGIDIGTCCANFFDTVEFAKLMIGTLASIPSEQSYSIVQFSTTAKLLTNLTSPSEALDVLDNIIFSGGRTNHAEAISVCHESLMSSGDERKSLMLFITDGDPSEPTDDPAGVAEMVAREASNAGTFIMPVLINLSRFEADLSSTLVYLKDIGSSGSQIFYVSGFDGLDGLQQGLLAQVSCYT